MNNQLNVPTRYPHEFKRRVVLYAERYSNREAERKFGIAESNIRRWKKSRAMLFSKAFVSENGRRKRLVKRVSNNASNDFLYQIQNFVDGNDKIIELPRFVKTSSRQPTPTSTNTSTQSDAAGDEDDGEEVCIRWNSHHNNMKSTFPYLLEREQYVDVTLTSEGKSLKCHKLILSSCSGYFDELLAGIEPFQHPVIFLNGVPFWLLKAILDFMYAGEVHIDQNKLPQLLKVAQMLQIKGLTGKENKTEGEEQPPPPPTQPEKIEPIVAPTPKPAPEIKPAPKIPEPKPATPKITELRPILPKPAPSEVKSPMTHFIEKIPESKEPPKVELKLPLKTADALKLKMDAFSMKTDAFSMKTDAFPMKTDAFPMKTDAFPMKTEALKLKTDGLPLKTDTLPRLRVVSKKDVPFALTRRSIVFKAIPVMSSTVDPMSLLKTAFVEEVPDTSRPPRDLPKKIMAGGKKMRKRKSSENQLQDTIPTPVYRKGTRSRPNVKVPRYYHNDYDTVLKKKMLKRELKETLKISRLEDTTFDLSNVKTEPIDIEDTDVQFMEITTDDIPEESDLSRDCDATSSSVDEKIQTVTKDSFNDSTERFFKMEADPMNVTNGTTDEEILPDVIEDHFDEIIDENLDENIDENLDENFEENLDEALT